MNLLVDIGNTRLKWVMHANGQIGHSVALFHQQENFYRQLMYDWQLLPMPKIIAISSVSSKTTKSFVLKAAQALWENVKIIEAKTATERFGVKNGYLYPQKLGVDRWLCLIASYHYDLQAVWVVDCGTAITLDFIDSQGQHQGGVIAPGLRLMKKVLSTQTCLLDYSDDHAPLALGTQTSQAIFSGTLYAAIGLIEQLTHHSSLKAALILTGGDAEIIAQYLSCTVIIEPDLVLKGLAISTQEYL